MSEAEKGVPEGVGADGGGGGSADSKGGDEGARRPATKVPSLLRNYVSLAGLALVVASLACIVLLFLIELTSHSDNPYLGILTYIIFPGFMALGLAVVLVGVFFERRRRRKLSPEEIAAFPVIDLNNPRRRRRFFAFAGVVVAFLFLSAFGSYRAYEHTESVAFCGQTCHVPMKPEFVSFQVAPHSRLHCVDCHVGGGAQWYVRSKLAGARQLYALAFDTFERPIRTPVHNMRPARDTCAQCHWPEKFHGTQLKVFNRYSYDEQNTFRQTRLLIHVGGGSERTGIASGIHWHMNVNNEVTFIASDEQRQTIPWVRLKDGNGNVTEFAAAGFPMSRDEIERAPKRTMDCIDCHNRPTHIYVPPDEAVDDAFVAGRLDQSIPYMKRQAVELLSKPYKTEPEALAAIAAGLDEFYRANYGDVYASKRDSLRRATDELQRIYRTYTFPEMKTNWSTHPNNISHFYFQGCFRCHDGKHQAADGRLIRSDCNVCHTVLDQTEGQTLTPAQNGAFRHPVDLGDRAKFNCNVCHMGDKPFMHPVNLGDISQFECSQCHSGQGVRVKDR